VSHLQSGGLEGIVHSKLIRGPELVSWVSSSGERLLDVVQRESVVVRVHHIEQSGSAEGSEGSVVLKDSPHVESNVSADVIVVVLHDLSGNVDSSEGDEGSVRLFPLSEEIVDWVEARVLLELHLPFEAIVLCSNSGSHVLSEIVSWGVWRERESNGGSIVARPQSVLDGWVGQRSLSILVRRDGVVRHPELRRHRVVSQLHGKHGSIGRESLGERSSASLSSSTEFSS